MFQQKRNALNYNRVEWGENRDEIYPAQAESTKNSYIEHTDFQQVTKKINKKLNFLPQEISPPTQKSVILHRHSKEKAKKYTKNAGTPRSCVQEYHVTSNFYFGKCYRVGILCLFQGIKKATTTRKSARGYNIQARTKKSPPRAKKTQVKTN